MFSQKVYALKKCLDTQSKRFENTTQTFFDIWGFQKLKKNLKVSHVFRQIDKSTLSKKVVLPIFYEQYEQFFFH